MGNPDVCDPRFEFYSRFRLYIRWSSLMDFDVSAQYDVTVSEYDPNVLVPVTTTLRTNAILTRKINKPA